MEQNKQVPIWLQDIKAVLFDIDGVLHRTGVPLPGATDLPHVLAELDIDYLCVTNNATRTPQQVADQLTKINIPIPASHIMTSALATAQALRKRARRGTRVYALGMRGLHEALFADGYFVLDTQQPDYVVVGADFEVTYEKLKLACLAIRAGANFIGTNPDTTFPSAEGIIPGCGALLAALEAATGVSPEIIGKPQPALFQSALERLGTTPAETAMVGDRLDTDIMGAYDTGLRTVFVGTGIDPLEAVAGFPISPDLSLADLQAFLTVLQSARKER